MIDMSFLTVLGCCLVVAIGGYHMFGSLVEDQITISLQNFSSAEVAMDCLTWLMILTAFSKFTLTAFPLALGIEEIFAPCVPNESVSEVVSSLIKLFLIGCSLLVGSHLYSFIQLSLRSCRDGLYNGRQRHFPSRCSLEKFLDPSLESETNFGLDICCIW